METPELKMMEVALAEERNLLRAVMEGLPDQVYVKDLSSRFVLVNDAVRAFFGKQGFDQIIGRTDYDLFPSDAAASFRAEELEILERGEAVQTREALVYDAAGKAFWLQTTKVPLRNTYGQVTGLIGVNRDITARRLAEEEMRAANEALRKTLGELQISHEQLKQMQLELIEAEKMKSIGRLAAGIAHEVKNPLAILGLGLGVLSSVTAKANLDVTTIVGQMRDALGRAELVIRGLLDFASPRQLVLKPVPLCDLLERSLVLVQHELKKSRVTVRRAWPEALPVLPLDSNKIEQVFVNAFTNAAHAMEGGGTLTIRVLRREVVDGEYASHGRPSPFTAGEAVVVVEIDDTGKGIPQEQVGRVFEPFFTTKVDGKGTGLGLSVVRSIIDLHRGWIDLRNRSEGGVRMTLVLKAGSAHGVEACSI